MQWVRDDIQWVRDDMQWVRDDGAFTDLTHGQSRQEVLPAAH